MMEEQRCKCRFIVVNRRELNIFQAAEKAWLLILGVHLHPVHPLPTPLPWNLGGSTPMVLHSGCEFVRKILKQYIV